MGFGPRIAISKPVVEVTRIRTAHPTVVRSGAGNGATGGDQRVAPRTDVARGVAIGTRYRVGPRSEPIAHRNHRPSRCYVKIVVRQRHDETDCSTRSRYDKLVAEVTTRLASLEVRSEKFDLGDRFCLAGCDPRLRRSEFVRQSRARVITGDDGRLTRDGVGVPIGRRADGGLRTVRTRKPKTKRERPFRRGRDVATNLVLIA